VQDRCRRLELLLLSDLGPRDYWHAAAWAAWRRGRGYFAVAILLWMASAVSGSTEFLQAVAAMASGVVLWGLYFAVGFRAFTRGVEANLLGMGLTLGLPSLVFILARLGWPALAALLPPGTVYYAIASDLDLAWLAGTLLGAGAALIIARWALAHCDGELRQWYDAHHGEKTMG
jgi:hypothetical protein